MSPEWIEYNGANLRSVIIAYSLSRLSRYLNEHRSKTVTARYHSIPSSLFCLTISLCIYWLFFSTWMETFNTYGRKIRPVGRRAIRPIQRNPAFGEKESRHQNLSPKGIIYVTHLSRARRSLGVNSGAVSAYFGVSKCPWNRCTEK